MQQHLARELTKKVTEYLALKNQHLDPDNKETLGEFMGFWLKEVRFTKGLKNSTKERYLGLYENYILNPDKFLISRNKNITNIDKLFISNIPMIKINTRCIQEYYNALHESDISSSTIISINKLLKPFVKYAYINNTLIRDYSIGLIIPNAKEEKNVKRILGMTLKMYLQ
ncbi:MAG: hypothetical protein RSB41_03835 [Bacilli bacterium]